MQFAISGIYQQGQIHLAELPPFDEPSDVMVVFLPKTHTNLSKNKTAKLFALEKSEVEIEEPKTAQALLSMEELYGSLKPYVNGYLSDEDIENSIAEGAIDSGMAGKTDA